MCKSAYIFRHLARVVVEADTPIKISTGTKDFITDAPVLLDINGLPYIPGTSLAGVFRRLFEKDQADSVFGVQDKEEAAGSRIIISDAILCDEQCVPIEAPVLKENRSDFVKEYEALPIRQHVKIDSKGVSARACKFDEQIVFKGSRFCFEITLISKDAEGKQVITNILDALCQGHVRIGGGTRKGFGQLTVCKAYCKTLDLSVEDELQSFINKSSSLSDSSFWQNVEPYEPNDSERTNEWAEYKLNLKAKDLFLFSTGFPSEDGKSNFTPVSEKIISWESDNGKFESWTLIPATSVKGALAHRIAYHYNKCKNIGYCYENGKWLLKSGKTDYSEQENPAVVALFGSVQTKGKKASRGNVIIKDFFFKNPTNEHYLNHVVIDPFSGSSNGVGLFTERCLYTNEEVTLDIKVKKAILEQIPEVKSAFEAAVGDLKEGLLPLGGGVNRGNGIFIQSEQYENK